MLIKRRTGDYRLTRYRRDSPLGIVLGYSATPLDRTREKLGVEVVISYWELAQLRFEFDLVRLRKHDMLTQLFSNF